jgi:parallel beta-helix repeat protein
MTTYYVSSVIGSDNNAGTSATAPLASLQAAADVVHPGDTVEVMNGTYTSSSGADVLDITTSGTAAAPIVFEAAPGATPVIDSSGVWNGINISASYITIKGFTVVGDAANFTQSYALAHASPDDPTLDGNGIAVNSAPNFGPGGGTALPNHIIIENNTVYDEPGGGIYTQGADYVQILNNNVHDNAHWSAFGNSGISIGVSQNLDNGPSPHIIIEGNTSVNNAEMVPTYTAGAITDGEGIIIDTNPGYTGGFLIQGNTTSGNSGPGIEVNNSENAVVTGNTTQGDLTNPNLASEGELFNNQSTNVIFSNNTTNIPAPPAAPPGELVANGTFETSTFAGWAESGNVGPLNGDPNQPQLWITQAAHTGNNAAAFGAIGSDGTISQTLTTVVGQTYTLDFWLANLSGGPNDFTAKIGGVTELQLVNAAAQPYTEYSYTYTATSTSTTLEFDAMQQPAQWDLDDVSVAPTGSVTPPPTTTLTSIRENPSSGDLDAGKTVALTLGFSAAVTVADGTPTLTLNDGGIATYSGGSGTNALTFSYTVGAGQNTSALAATAVNNSASITDGAGNAAIVSLTGLPQSGPQIDTTPPPAPTITSDKITGKHAVLKGTEAEAGTTISIYDGTTRLGTTTTGTNGTWTFTMGRLANGTHVFTATATDAAGNVSAASSPHDPNVGVPSNADLAHVGFGVKPTLGYFGQQ